MERYKVHTRMEYELHKLGYTVFTIPGLTLPEIERLLDGVAQEAAQIEAMHKKMERDAGYGR